MIDARTLFFSTRDTVGKFVCVGFSLDSFLVIFFSLKKKKKTMLKEKEKNLDNETTRIRHGHWIDENEGGREGEYRVAL